MTLRHNSRLRVIFQKRVGTIPAPMPSSATRESASAPTPRRTVIILNSLASSSRLAEAVARVVALLRLVKLPRVVGAVTTNRRGKRAPAFPLMASATFQTSPCLRATDSWETFMRSANKISHSVLALRSSWGWAGHPHLRQPLPALWP